MSNVKEAASVIDTGQQLLNLYGDVWAAEAEALSPLNPAAGLDLCAADRDLTPATLEELGTDELAAIGKQGLAGWLDAQARALEIEQANARTVAAGEQVLGFIQSLEGRDVTVTALNPDNDIPISLRRRDSLTHEERPIRYLSSATGTLKIWSAHRGHYSIGNINPNLLGLARQPSCIPRPYAYLAIALRDIRTNEPRVSLSIEE